MYANVRQYRIAADMIDETMHLADTELADRLAEEPGFVAYELMATEDGSVCSMTIFEDREGAEALRGSDLMVDRAAAPELDEGEYWAEDLKGCRVVTAEDHEVGVVQDMRALPSCEVLEVGDLLVPMVGDAVLSIDADARRIVVDPEFLGVESS